MLGFESDTRPECTIATRDAALICIDPSDTCEQYVNSWQAGFCFNSENTICASWAFILFAVLCGNALQMTFEISMIYSQRFYLAPDEGFDDVSNG